MYFEGLEGQVPAHTYEISIPMVQVYDRTAIHTFHFQGRIGNDVTPPWKATSVYHNMNGQWKVVHANWSVIKME